MSSKEWLEFKNNINDFRLILKKYSADTAIKNFEKDFELLSAFYDVNEQRNEYFIETILNNGVEGRRGKVEGATEKNAKDVIPSTVYSLPSTATEAIVVVTGGFHSEGLEDIWKQNNISHIVITPSITRDTKLSDIVYAEVAKQQARTLEAQAIAAKLLEMMPAGTKFEVLTDVELEELSKIPAKSFSSMFSKLLKGNRKYLEEALISALNKISGVWNDDPALVQGLGGITKFALLGVKEDGKYHFSITFSLKDEMEFTLNPDDKINNLVQMAKENPQVAPGAGEWAYETPEGQKDLLAEIKNIYQVQYQGVESGNKIKTALENVSELMRKAQSENADFGEYQEQVKNAVYLLISVSDTDKNKDISPDNRNDFIEMLSAIIVPIFKTGEPDKNLINSALSFGKIRMRENNQLESKFIDEIYSLFGPLTKSALFQPKAPAFKGPKTSTEKLISGLLDSVLLTIGELVQARYSEFLFIHPQGPVKTAMDYIRTIDEGNPRYIKNQANINSALVILLDAIGDDHINPELKNYFVISLYLIIKAILENDNPRRVLQEYKFDFKTTNVQEQRVKESIKKLMDSIMFVPAVFPGKPPAAGRAKLSAIPEAVITTVPKEVFANRGKEKTLQSLGAPAEKIGKAYEVLGITKDGKPILADRDTNELAPAITINEFTEFSLTNEKPVTVNFKEWYIKHPNFREGLSLMVTGDKGIIMPPHRGGARDKVEIPSGFALLITEPGTFSNFALELQDPEFFNRVITEWIYPADINSTKIKEWKKASKTLSEEKFDLEAVRDLINESEYNRQNWWTDSFIKDHPEIAQALLILRRLVTVYYAKEAEREELIDLAKDVMSGEKTLEEAISKFVLQGHKAVLLPEGTREREIQEKLMKKGAKKIITGIIKARQIAARTLGKAFNPASFNQRIEVAAISAEEKLHGLFNITHSFITSLAKPGAPVRSARKLQPVWRAPSWPEIEKLPALQNLNGLIEDSWLSPRNFYDHIKLVAEACGFFVTGDFDKLYGFTSEGKTEGETAGKDIFELKLGRLFDELNNCKNAQELKEALILAAEIHDIGKYYYFQTSHNLNSTNMADKAVFEPLADKGIPVPENVKTIVKALISLHNDIGDIDLALNKEKWPTNWILDSIWESDRILNMAKTLGKIEKLNFRTVMLLVMIINLSDVLSVKNKFGAQYIADSFEKMRDYTKDKASWKAVKNALIQKLKGKGRNPDEDLKSFEKLARKLNLLPSDNFVFSIVDQKIRYFVREKDTAGFKRALEVFNSMDPELLSFYSIRDELDKAEIALNISSDTDFESFMKSFPIENPPEAPIEWMKLLDKNPNIFNEARIKLQSKKASIENEENEQQDLMNERRFTDYRYAEIGIKAAASKISEGVFIPFAEGKESKGDQDIDWGGGIDGAPENGLAFYKDEIFALLYYAGIPFEASESHFNFCDEVNCEGPKALRYYISYGVVVPPQYGKLVISFINDLRQHARKKALIDNLESISRRHLSGNAFYYYTLYRLMIPKEERKDFEIIKSIMKVSEILQLKLDLKSLTSICTGIDFHGSANPEYSEDGNSRIFRIKPGEGEVYLKFISFETPGLGASILKTKDDQNNDIEYLAVPRKYESLADLMVTLGVNRLAFFGELVNNRTDKVSMMFTKDLRILGNGEISRSMGNKEKSFIIFKYLGLDFPEGFNLSEGQVEKIIGILESYNPQWEASVKKKATRYGINQQEVYLYLWELILVNLFQDFESVGIKDPEEKEKIIKKEIIELGKKGWFSIRSNEKGLTPGLYKTSEPDERPSFESLKDRIAYVFNSWMSPAAAANRKRNKISDKYDLPIIFQRWVSAEPPEENAGQGLYCSGSFSTRSPKSGKKKKPIEGLYLPNKRGGKIMSGQEKAADIDELAESYPEIYKELVDAAEKLEDYVGPQQVEFTVENGKVYFLQTRELPFSPHGMANYAEERIKELEEKGDPEGSIQIGSRMLSIPAALSLIDKIRSRPLGRIKAEYQDKLKIVGKGEYATTGGVLQGLLCLDITKAEKMSRDPKNEGKNIIVVLKGGINNLQMDAAIDEMLTGRNMSFITLYGNQEAHEITVMETNGVGAIINLQNAFLNDAGDELIIRESEEYPETHLKNGEPLVIDADQNAVLVAGGTALNLHSLDVTEEVPEKRISVFGKDWDEFKEEYDKELAETFPGWQELAHNKKMKFLNDLHNELNERLKKLKESSQGVLNEESRKAISLATLRRHYVHELLVDAANEKVEEEEKVREEIIEILGIDEKDVTTSKTENGKIKAEIKIHNKMPDLYQRLLMNPEAAKLKKRSNVEYSFEIDNVGDIRYLAEFKSPFELILRDSDKITSLDFTALGCGLKKLTLKNLPNLKSVHFLRQGIKSVIFEEGLDNLENIAFQECALDQVFAINTILPKLEILDLKSNRIKKLDMEGNAPLLKGIYMSDCKNLDEAVFGDLPSLVTLDLSSSNIGKRIEFGNYLGHLENLYLDHCNFTGDATVDVITLTGLKDFDCSYSKVKKIVIWQGQNPFNEINVSGCSNLEDAADLLDFVNLRVSNRAVLLKGLKLLNHGIMGIEGSDVINKIIKNGVSKFSDILKGIPAPSLLLNFKLPANELWKIKGDKLYLMDDVTALRQFFSGMEEIPSTHKDKGSEAPKKNFRPYSGVLKDTDPVERVEKPTKEQLIDAITLYMQGLGVDIDPRVAMDLIGSARMNSLIKDFLAQPGNEGREITIQEALDIFRSASKMPLDQTKGDILEDYLYFSLSLTLPGTYSIYRVIHNFVVLLTYILLPLRIFIKTPFLPKDWDKEEIYGTKYRAYKPNAEGIIAGIFEYGAMNRDPEKFLKDHLYSNIQSIRQEEEQIRREGMSRIFKAGETGRKWGVKYQRAAGVVGAGIIAGLMAGLISAAAIMAFAITIPVAVVAAILITKYIDRIGAFFKEVKEHRLQNREFGTYTKAMTIRLFKALQMEAGLHTITAGKGASNASMEDLETLSKEIITKGIVPFLDQEQVLTDLIKEDPKALIGFFANTAEAAEAALRNGARIIAFYEYVPSSKEMRNLKKKYPYAVFMAELPDDISLDKVEPAVASVGKSLVDGIIFKGIKAVPGGFSGFIEDKGRGELLKRISRKYPSLIIEGAGGIISGEKLKAVLNLPFKAVAGTSMAFNRPELGLAGCIGKAKEYSETAEAVRGKKAVPARITEAPLAANNEEAAPGIIDLFEGVDKKNKIEFILTDGGDNSQVGIDASGKYFAKEELKQAFAKAKKQGIEIVGVGFNTEQTKIFDNYIQLDTKNVEKLAEIILKIAKVVAVKGSLPEGKGPNKGDLLEKLGMKKVIANNPLLAIRADWVLKKWGPNAHRVYVKYIAPIFETFAFQWVGMTVLPMILPFFGLGFWLGAILATVIFAAVHMIRAGPEENFKKFVFRTLFSAVFLITPFFFVPIILPFLNVIQSSIVSGITALVIHSGFNTLLYDLSKLSDEEIAASHKWFWKHQRILELFRNLIPPARPELIRNGKDVSEMFKDSVKYIEEHFGKVVVWDNPQIIKNAEKQVKPPKLYAVVNENGINTVYIHKVLLSYLIYTLRNNEALVDGIKFLVYRAGGQKYFDPWNNAEYDFDYAPLKNYFERENKRNSLKEEDIQQAEKYVKTFVDKELLKIQVDENVEYRFSYDDLGGGSSGFVFIGRTRAVQKQ